MKFSLFKKVVTDDEFLEKWAVVREKKKATYILTRGFLKGLAIYLIWAILTLVFDMRKLAPSVMKHKFLCWFILLMLLGFVISLEGYVANEKRYLFLMEHKDK